MAIAREQFNLVRHVGHSDQEKAEEALRLPASLEDFFFNPPLLREFAEAGERQSKAQ